MGVGQEKRRAREIITGVAPGESSVPERAHAVVCGPGSVKRPGQAHLRRRGGAAWLPRARGTESGGHGAVRVLAADSRARGLLLGATEMFEN